jgi:hypothetical protein
MIGDGLPEIVDVVRLPRGADVVVDLTNQSTALLVFDEWLNGNAPLSKSRCSSL